MMALATWHVSIATMCNGEVNAATAARTCAVTQTVELLYASYSLSASVFTLTDACTGHIRHQLLSTLHCCLLAADCVTATEILHCC